MDPKPARDDDYTAEALDRDAATDADDAPAPPPDPEAPPA